MANTNSNDVHTAPPAAPPGSLVTACYLVPGLPHVLLAAEKSPSWLSLKASYDLVRKEIEASDAEMILYFSSQWLSVLGYLFQADPEPEWTLVDHNWHEYGSIHYKFKIDTEFAHHYSQEVKALGHYVREVNYRGFPIDTGSIVAQKLINPVNRLPAAMSSCNMYGEKQETLAIGQAAMRAIEKYGKRVAVVVVSGLSFRFETKEIDPAKDRISSSKDDEWNRKVLDIMAEGRLEDVSEIAREYSRQANADMGFKGLWWLNGLCGKTNDFTGRVFDYQPIWGTGAAIVGLYPTRALTSVSERGGDEADLVDRLSVTTSRAGQAETAHVVHSTGRSSVQSVQPVKVLDGALVGSVKAPPPVGPYPHARREGEFIFLSGCGPRKAGSKEIPGVKLNERGEVTSYDIEVQTRSVFENIEFILADVGCSLDDVVDVQAYLTDMKRDFQVFNRIYGEYFGKRKDSSGVPIGPCRTTIEVGALPTPIAVELKVTARIRS
jgi:2-aminophenol/2-amino-5-chlorophenol 1,6-dioxygenase alpha subunit